MKKLILTAAFVLIPILGFSQQTGDTTETNKINSKINLESFLNRAQYFSDIHSETESSLFLIDSRLLNDENFLALKLNTLYPEQSSQINTAALPQNILMPLYNQYKEGQKFNMVRTILGVTQAAAVGYMAYRHIKKYGFWK